MGWELWPAWLLVATIGASIGSFLNVVVYRVPRQISLVYPPSHCPNCKTRLGPTENIPIFGWLLLRGRCRHCRTPVPIRYPAVETLTMSLFLLCFAVWGLSWQAVSGALLLSWLVPLALIDLETFLLPEELTRSALAVGFGLRLLLPLLEGRSGWSEIAASAIAGIGGAVLGILSLEIVGWIGLVLLGKDAMGGGDGKLLAAVGMWLGWQAVLVVLFVSCLTGTVGGIATLAIQRQQKWGKPIPFGPYLVLGSVAALFVGPQLVQWYARLAGF
ncbi:A24 family peptidase [Synechococcus sp. PCC 7336]|uniref:prepilin peptidase n=1 Tax=Synechococcus sp. PCC 7336 TaxID=195250 RepID=UPI00034AE63C|nr:A24 family peptidase [Synechococcus sp. PCC 7336]